MTRPAATTGNQSLPASYGARDTRANLIPFPSRSILAADAPLEPIDLSQSRFNEALALALLVNLFAWFGFALILRALFF